MVIGLRNQKPFSFNNYQFFKKLVGTQFQEIEGEERSGKIERKRRTYKIPPQ